jgi:tripartite-type tricarboxylate transporter receptor subunit TctC
MKRILVAALTIGIAAHAAAQADYASRPIRLVVPFAAGGSADNTARALAEGLKSALGQPVIVDNRPGASGLIAAEAVAREKADGYTVLYHSLSLAITPRLVKSSFDPTKQLAPVAQIASTPYVLVVGSTLPIRTLPDFVAYAKAHPGQLACATYGIGSPPHIALELFKQAAKIDLLHVPYKGFAQALPDLISGQLQCAIDTPGNVAPGMQGQRVFAVATTAAGSTLPALKDIPSFSTAYPAAAMDGWSGLFAPAGTAPAILEKLNGAVQQIEQERGFATQINSLGMRAVSGSVSDFTTLMRNDYARYSEIIRANGIEAK